MSQTLTEEAAALLGLKLTPEQEAQFDTYAHELAVWNAHTNLTAIVEPEAVRVRHFLDSLTVAKAVPLPAGTRVIDVGRRLGTKCMLVSVAGEIKEDAGNWETLGVSFEPEVIGEHIGKLLMQVTSGITPEPQFYSLPVSLITGD